jgi:hypothetical protein
MPATRQMPSPKYVSKRRRVQCHFRDEPTWPRDFSVLTSLVPRMRAFSAGWESAVGPPSPSEAQSIVVRKAIKKRAHRSNKIFSAAKSAAGLKHAYDGRVLRVLRNLSTLISARGR